MRLWRSRVTFARSARTCLRQLQRPRSELVSEEPLMDVAHLGHLELLTPKPEESLRFFIDVMGMTESGRKGNSVYLRAYDDYERYSLQLTASHTSGLGHAAFRARSPQALRRRVKALEGSGAASAGMKASRGTAPPIVSMTRTGMSSSLMTRRNGMRRRRRCVRPSKIRPKGFRRAASMCEASITSIASRWMCGPIASSFKNISAFASPSRSCWIRARKPACG